jgi:AcrR family transcriptional regulator
VKQSKSSATPSPAPRSSYHHGDLRQSLIDAAIGLIQEGEISQVSLREVARRVGVSHNAPYRHFPDKEALLIAVSEQGFQRLRSATEQALEQSSAEGGQRLMAIGQAYVRFAVQNPAYYRVMFSAYGCGQDEGLQAAMAQSFAVLLKVIEAGQAAGSFRTDNALQMAQTAWAFVHGIAMLAIDGQLSVPQGEAFDRFLQFSTRMLIEGFAAA